MKSIDSASVGVHLSPPSDKSATNETDREPGVIRYGRADDLGEPPPPRSGDIGQTRRFTLLLLLALAILTIVVAAGGSASGFEKTSVSVSRSEPAETRTQNGGVPQMRAETNLSGGH